ncbi:MAG: hypothetical protein WC755_02970 [Candidatus Woesearchaeota archaeon]|jgi:hypothetical protein
MKIKQLTSKDYDKILELDKKVYPTKNPVTKETIASWYKRNPEFGFIIEGERKGLCVAIPLNKKGWLKLISGKLMESQITNKYFFDNSCDKEIGIHIYHIEKFGSKKGIYIDALKKISNIIENLRNENQKLKICGISGLCVSSSGIGLFYNKFNCRERNFINTEHILQKNGKLICFDEKKENLIKKLNQGYSYMNRCKMLILYSNEQSIVWSYLK